MKNYDEFIEGLKKDEKIPVHVMDKFEETLRTLPDKNKKIQRRFKWPSAVAAAAALVCTMSVGVYAAAKLYEYTVEGNDEYGIDVSIDKATDEYIPPITVTPEYLPEGYKIWEEGTGVWKYSLNGEYGGAGLSIYDAGYLKNFTIPRISNYKEMQIGEAQALCTYTEGADIPYHIFLFYEDDGHAIEVYGDESISKDDMMKVCENITYVEAPEKDPNHEYEAFSVDEVEIMKNDGDNYIDRTALLPEKNIVKVGENLGLWGLDFPDMQGSTTVTDIHITDTVNTSLISESTVSDYDRVMGCIENDRLKPYTRTVTEWTGDRYVKRELGTVNVKNVEVTIELKNTSEMDYNDVNVQPSWMTYKKEASGEYKRYEIPNYTITDSYWGNNYYDIVSDNGAYYFDSSAFIGDTHFYNTTLKAGETKEVHLWFAIPEDVIEDSYLVFGENTDNVQFVKIVR